MFLRRWKASRWALVGLWAAVICLGLAGNAWIRGQVEARRVQEGERSALKAADAVRRARALEAAGEHRNAEAQLNFAAALLRSVDGAPRGDGYASVLLDLASLKLSDGAESPSARAEARSLLKEAWNLGETSPPLRAAIARDLGALEVLTGRLDAAEEWYSQAQELDPLEPIAEERLRTLRRTKHAPASSKDHG